MRICKGVILSYSEQVLGKFWLSLVFYATIERKKIFYWQKISKRQDNNDTNIYIESFVERNYEQTRKYFSVGEEFKVLFANK